MIFVDNGSITDPKINLAIEEWLLNNHNGRHFFFPFSNTPCLVVGKHQNAFAEANHSYRRQHEIPLLRRITGGGTVYHDLGNLNLSFIQPHDPTLINNWKHFFKPLVEYLENLGHQTEINTRNSLYVDGFKVAGTAQYAGKKGMISHASTLWFANLTALNKSLEITGQFQSKAMPSVPAKTANILEILKEDLDMQQIIGRLKDLFLAHFGDDGILKITPEIIAEAETYREKYDDWSWNFGKSPDFTFTHDGIELSASEGRIRSLSVDGKEEVSAIGLPLNTEILSSFLKNKKLIDVIPLS